MMIDREERTTRVNLLAVESRVGNGITKVGRVVATPLFYRCYNTRRRFDANDGIEYWLGNARPAFAAMKKAPPRRL